MSRPIPVPTRLCFLSVGVLGVFTLAVAGAVQATRVSRIVDRLQVADRTQAALRARERR
jgi:hypothetical protein